MEAWIGLAHVKPKSGNRALADALGAFVPAVGLAPSDIKFAEALAYLLEQRDFDVVEITEMDPLRVRIAQGKVDEELLELASTLSSETPIYLGTFHSYVSGQE
jgi:hypothetical protein